MRIEENYPLEKHNTFRLPVKARWFIEYENEEELGCILRDEYFQELHTLHIGEGSNLLFVDNFNGAIIHSGIRGIDVVEESDSAVLLRIGAAEHWDDIVAYAVSEGLGGIENLSGIPGEAGAAAVQNIGAYGAEIKDVIETVEAYNQLSFEKKTFTNRECEYAYRHSYFKNEHNDPHIITFINIRLTKCNHNYNTGYGSIIDALGDREITLLSVRRAVLETRNQKLPALKELGNAGSFFMNPVIDKTQFNELLKAYPDMPHYGLEGDRVKLSAGWLIEKCGMKGVRHGHVGTYDKQALVLVNYGSATGHEIALFAESIRAVVQDKFGIDLIPEVKYAGC